MGCETPEDIFLRTDFADAQAIGVDILYLSQATLINECLQFNHRVMILENMAHHQDPGILRRQRDQILPFTDLQGEWFFHKNMLTRMKGCLRHSIVCHRRG